MRAGNTHEMYGAFIPSNATEFAAGASNAGAFYNPDTGVQTVTNEQVGRGASIVSEAVNTAVNAGGLEGLNSRELAATLYKRVADAVRTIAYKQLEEAERHSDPTEHVRLREDIQKGASVAYDAMNRGVVNEITNMTGVNAREVGNPATKIKSVEELNALISRPGMGPLANRVQELGGPEALMEGNQRVIGADGLDQTYMVGQEASKGRRGGYGSGDFFQSIYRTDLGRLMMAQYMGQMMWMKTGGDVLNDAAQWGGNQYNYVGMENYGSGTPDGPAGFMARQEIAANRQGALAYEQYGFMKELGYAYGGNSLMGRWGNDLKMGLGIGAVAGIGTYSAAGLGMIAGYGGLAAAGLGMTVGAGVAAAVAVPAMAGSAYNVATDQDSYSGWSPKNMLAAWYGMDTVGDELKLQKQGYPKERPRPRRNVAPHQSLLGYRVCAGRVHPESLGHDLPAARRADWHRSQQGRMAVRWP